MQYDSFIVRPIDRETADELCEDHSHAESLPNSSKHHMRLEIDGRVAGLAAWGYGVNPAGTPNKLFGDAGNVEDYLELCRFFVYDWVPKNTASKFLAITHKKIKQHTDVKWLYTYAAGFQGVIGTIYQASNYDYIGTQEIVPMLYVPEVGDEGVLVHSMALWHRWHTLGGADFDLEAMCEKFDQQCYRWHGHNFRYIYWLCSDEEKRRLMQHAKFDIHDENPDKGDLDIWITDTEDNRTDIPPEKAKQVPLVKLPTS